MNLDGQINLNNLEAFLKVPNWIAKQIEAGKTKGEVEAELLKSMTPLGRQRYHEGPLKEFLWSVVKK